MKPKIFSARGYTIGVDTVLFLIRLVAGIAFLQHGWGKIQNPLNWMGNDAHVPGFLQALAALSEFGGAMAWILGFLTRLGALGITCTMTVAVAMHRFVLGDPFVSTAGGRSYELAAIYLLVALLLLVAGPGRLSLDRKVFGDAS
jgi:putative oxidoreductase